MKTIFLLALSTLISSSAFANTYVKCGTAVDADNQTVVGYELELSSESDVYQGPVGQSWNMKLGREQSEWLAANKNIVAKTTKVDGSTNIEIKITTARSVSGAVGVVYKLIDLYGDQPTLEKYTMGGFAGSVKVGTFACLSAND